MTIDERLEKLTERHEALAQSMELFQHQRQQDAEDIRSLFRTTEVLLHTAEADGESIRILLRTAEADGENIRVLLRTASVDGENIRSLARIAEIHERRLTDLEGQ